MSKVNKPKSLTKSRKRHIKNQSPKRTFEDKDWPELKNMNFWGLTYKGKYSAIMPTSHSPKTYGHDPIYKFFDSMEMCVVHFYELSKNKLKLLEKMIQEKAPYFDHVWRLPNNRAPNRMEAARNFIGESDNVPKYLTALLKSNKQIDFYEAVEKAGFGSKFSNYCSNEYKYSLYKFFHEHGVKMGAMRLCGN